MTESRGRIGGSMIAGLGLIALGVLFLIGQLIGGQFWHYAWPFIIIIIGLLFFVGMLAGGRPVGGLAIPGSIITMIGLILLVQNAFEAWLSWVYAWALIPASVGIGIYIFGAYCGRPGERRVGALMAWISIVVFLVNGLLFEAIAGLAGRRTTGGLLWSALLIALGLYLLIARSGLLARRGTAGPPPPETPGTFQPLAPPEAPPAEIPPIPTLPPVPPEPPPSEPPAER